MDRDDDDLEKFIADQIARKYAAPERSAGYPVASKKSELWFYRGLSIIRSSSTRLGYVGCPWPCSRASSSGTSRVTLCTLGNYASDRDIPGVNQLVQHEADRCDADTGARGLDIILNYALNDVSAFISLGALSFVGISIFYFLAESVGETADNIERKAKPPP
jgi:hypothetical protein